MKVHAREKAKTRLSRDCLFCTILFCMDFHARIVLNIVQNSRLLHADKQYKIVIVPVFSDYGLL